MVDMRSHHSERAANRPMNFVASNEDLHCGGARGNQLLACSSDCTLGESSETSSETNKKRALDQIYNSDLGDRATYSNFQNNSAKYENDEILDKSKGCGARSVGHRSECDNLSSFKSLISEPPFAGLRNNSCTDLSTRSSGEDYTIRACLSSPDLRSSKFSNQWSQKPSSSLHHSAANYVCDDLRAQIFQKKIKLNVSSDYCFSYSNNNSAENSRETSPRGLFTPGAEPLSRDNSRESVDGSVSKRISIKSFHVPGVSKTDSDLSPIKVDTRSFADFSVSSIIGGSFRVISLLGRGIFGNVFQCVCLKDSDLATSSTAAIYGSTPNILAPSVIFPTQIHESLCKENEVFAVKVSRMSENAVKNIESEYNIIKNIAKSTYRETYIVKSYGKFDIHSYIEDVPLTNQEEKSSDRRLGGRSNFYSGTAMVLESMLGDTRALAKSGALSAPMADSKSTTPSGIPWKRFVYLMHHMVQAVNNLHKYAGVIHLDIKPENILVDNKLEIFKLCDFGSALSIDKAKALLESQAKSGLANIVPRFYRPPEVALGCYDSISAKVDVWSLAITFIEMYCFAGGKYAISARNNLELIASIFDLFPNKLPISFILNCVATGGSDMRAVIKENHAASNSAYNENGRVYLAKHEAVDDFQNEQSVKRADGDECASISKDIALRLYYIYPNSGVRFISHTIGCQRSHDIFNNNSNSNANIRSNSGVDQPGSIPRPASDLGRMSVLTPELRHLFSDEQQLQRATGKGVHGPSGTSEAGLAGIDTSGKFDSRNNSKESGASSKSSGVSKNGPELTSAAKSKPVNSYTTDQIFKLYNGRFLKIIKKMLVVDPENRISIESLLEMIEEEFRLNEINKKKDEARWKV